MDFTPLQSTTFTVVTIGAILFVCMDLIITARIDKKRKKKLNQ